MQRILKRIFVEFSSDFRSMTERRQTNTTLPIAGPASSTACLFSSHSGPALQFLRRLECLLFFISVVGAVSHPLHRCGGRTSARQIRLTPRSAL